MWEVIGFHRVGAWCIWQTMREYALCPLLWGEGGKAKGNVCADIILSPLPSQQVKMPFRSVSTWGMYTVLYVYFVLSLWDGLLCPKFFFY